VLKATIASVLALTAALSVAGCNGKPKDAADTSTAPAAAPADATGTPKTPVDHPPARPVGEIDLTGITRAEGGKNIFEVYTEKSELANQQVVVRGKVVKTNAGIMAKDWVHVRDGSGEEGKNDLTVTTTSKPLPNVGDTVLVTGTVVLDKDFGMGYQYPVMVENAEVKIEAVAAK
jgi:hypothetical protein